MRNLKRVLSLALALMMALSVMAFSGSASAAESTTIPVASDLYPDYDQTNYKEAVDVITALRIVEGADGMLVPDGVLKRSEATTIAARLLLGVNAAATLPNVGTVTGYTDVDSVDHWAAPYIAFCDNQGIVSGVGGGNFDPDGQLTGVAFAKVILTVLGYDADKESFKGDRWATNVAVALANAGISVKDSDGNPIDLSKPITREQAMEMTFQAIQTPLVEYNGSTITINGATVNLGSGKASYVTTTIAQEQTISDTTLSNTGDSVYTIEFGEKYFPKLVLDDDQKDDFGRPVSIWSYDDVKICTVANETVATWTTTFTKKDLYNALRGALTVDQIRNLDSSTITVTTDGVAEDTVANAKLPDESTGYAFADTGVASNIYDDRTDTSVKLGGNGTLIELYVSIDRSVSPAAPVVDVVVVNTYVGVIDSFTEATDTDAAYITLADTDDGSAIDVTLSGLVNADFVTDAFTEKDEDTVVLFTVASVDGAPGAQYIASVVPAEELSVTPTYRNERTSTSVAYFRVGSTTYYYSANYDGTEIAASDVDNKVEKVVYIDTYGYVVRVNDPGNIGNYAVVLDSATEGSWTNASSNTYKALLLFTDGTTEAVTVKNSASGLKDHIVTYSVGGNGVYTLTDKANNSGSSATEVTIKRNVPSLTVNATSYVANSKTIFLINTATSGGPSYKAYVGIGSVPTTTKAQDQHIVVLGDGETPNVALVVFVGAASEVDTGDSLKNITYVAVDSERQINENEDNDLVYYEYNAVVDGEITTVKFKDALNSATQDQLFDSTTADKDGLLSGTPVAEGLNAQGTGTVIVRNGNIGKPANYIITLGGTSYTYSDKTQVFEIEGGEITEIKMSRVNAVNDSSANVVAYVEKNVITALFLTDNVTAETYSVTFDANGETLRSGSSLPAKVTGLLSGDKITEPTAPQVKGKVFDGWYTEKGYTNLWNFATSTITSANVTLYAKWTNGSALAGSVTPAGDGSYTVGRTINPTVASSTTATSGTTEISYAYVVLGSSDTAPAATDINQQYTLTEAIDEYGATAFTLANGIDLSNGNHADGEKCYILAIDVDKTTGLVVGVGVTTVTLAT